MLKIKPKIYALALYQLCAQTADLDLALHNFSRVLAKHNKLSLLPEIIKSFSLIFNNKEKAVDAHMATPFKVGETEKNLVEQFIKKNKLARKVFWQMEIRPELLGGAVINIGDLQIDASLKRKLQLIKNNIK